MICKDGFRECTGCMFCYENGEHVVTKCACCCNDICEGDATYRIMGEVYCEKCVSYQTAERKF